MKTDLPKLIIEKHAGFNVVRGDLLPSGIKGACLNYIMPLIKEQEIVYVGHPYGHSGFALGLAGLNHNKKVTLFFAGEKVNTYIQDKTESLENVKCIFIKDAKQPKDLINHAKLYAKEKNALYLPIGFDFPLFTNTLINLAKSLNTSPKEVWVSSGSGITAKCLKKAWPKAQINIVDLGIMPGENTDSTVFSATENPEEAAKVKPPYPSAEYYDAKMWSFIEKNASPNSLIWNVA